MSWGRLSFRCATILIGGVAHSIASCAIEWGEDAADASSNEQSKSPTSQAVCLPHSIGGSPGLGNVPNLEGARRSFTRCSSVTDHPEQHGADLRRRPGA